MSVNGQANHANSLMREGEHERALEIYQNLKNLTNSSSWDWQIRSLEKKLKTERTVFLNQELGQILKQIGKIERIYVANLVHRQDRRIRITTELVKFGFSSDDVSFVEAIYGASSPNALQLFDHFRIADPKSYKSISALPNDVLAHDRAYSSVGVIGYLLTQEQIIQDAIENGFKKILVLDDDVFFSSEAPLLAYRFFNQVNNWMIVNLGASEHSCSSDKLLQFALAQANRSGYYTPIPYKTCGSFAVAYDVKVLDTLLEIIKEYVGVFDRALLSFFYSNYPDQCYVLRPAACCADVTESDIREARCMEEHALRMSWDISRHKEYLISKSNMFPTLGIHHDRPLRLAFAVTETGPEAVAGDYFTALELGSVLAVRYGWKVDYLREGPAWYELAGFDVVVAMREDFDPRRIICAEIDLITVGWARNWFERWCEQPWLGEFSLVLASSQMAARWMSDRIGRLVHVLRIATNPLIFNNAHRSAAPEFDFVFTGNYWGFSRDIMNSITGISDTFNGAIFGSNWDSFNEIAHLNRGFVSYKDLPAVYKRTTLVIDDANHVTKNWAAANSRIFDALAAGCLVITNSKTISNEVFAGELPVYTNSVELQELLAHFITNAEARDGLLIRLRNRVVREHTYAQRAFAFRSLFKNSLLV